MVLAACGSALLASNFCFQREHYYYGVEAGKEGMWFYARETAIYGQGGHMPATFYSCQYHRIQEFTAFFWPCYMKYNLNVTKVWIHMISWCSTPVGHQFLTISGRCPEVTPKIDHKMLELIISCVGYDRAPTILVVITHTTTFIAQKLQKKFGCQCSVKYY